MMGVTAGAFVGGTITYINYYRKHSIKASFVPLGISKPKLNFSKVQPEIYSHLSTDYEERGELDLGEEHITVKPNVFAQIGVIDVPGVRLMWTKHILPILRDTYKTSNLESMSLTDKAVEEDIVFCDIGSGVGNVCLQVLAETNCKKTVGIEVIPSRLRASVVATENAKKAYPEEFQQKEAVWIEDDLANCSEKLKKEGVNVIFTHSWMFDDNLMKILSEVIADVPSIQCVITSRKLDDQKLAKTNLQFYSKAHFTADWNDQAPFFVMLSKTANFYTKLTLLFTFLTLR
ncbi:hypothetical protein AGDE_05728 [Angomonas deanei]|nr:hypothetical protein AGDE_05728 [Angomonas deanei]|eukprot:EPY38203.1 hypothetical protein AGDE_05728 [Angomonas deanei]